MWRLRSIQLVFLVFAAALLQGACEAASWFPLGPFGGGVRSLAADPADPSRHLFLGTATGWLYDSHDGGGTWTRVGQINDRDDLAVDNILVDKNNPRRLIVGAWVVGKSTDGGIFVSEDYGKNWYSQAEMRGQSVRALTRSDSNPKELIAGTLSGVFRSRDNGVHWARISPAGSSEIHEVESVAIDPVDPNVIYVGTWHLPWKTTDGGASWHNMKDGIIDDSDVFSIIVDPTNPKVVYASACSGIYKSSNGGDLFHKVQGIPSTARRTRKLAQDPEQVNIVFAGTTEGLYRTTDAGAQWERMTPPDAIVNDVYIDPNDSKRVVIATERGGVYRSEDGGSSFESSNDGFSARQVSAYAQDARDPNTLYVGVVNDKATGGVFQSTDGAVHWTQQSEGLHGRDVFSLLSLPEGDLLAGTAHGLFRFANGTWADSSAIGRPLPRVATHAVARVPVLRSAPRPVPGPAPRRAPGPAPRPAPQTRPVMTRSPAVRAEGKRAKGKALVRTKVVVKRRTGDRNQPPVSDRRQHGSAKRAGGNKHPVLKRDGVRRKVNVAGKGTRVVAVSPRVALLREEASRKPASAQPAIVARAGLSPKQAEAQLTVNRAERKDTPGRVSSTVYTLARANGVIFAGTSDGLLQSGDEGQTWSVVKVPGLLNVHFLAMLPTSTTTTAVTDDPFILLAADLVGAAMSSDGGQNWQAVPLPPGLTQVGAVGLDGEKNIWIGGREGVWLSGDEGTAWKSLPNLFLTQVDSLFYDAPGQRMLVTAANSTAAFSVEPRTQKVTYLKTGWKLRFVRPVGNHLVAATLFDGMVVQPEMVATPLSSGRPE